MNTAENTEIVKNHQDGFWKFILWIVLGVSLLAVVVFAVNWLQTRNSLSKKLAALRAEGMPTNFAELDDFYAVPEGVTDTTDLWVDAINAVVLSDLDERGKSLPFVGTGSTPVPLPGEEWEEFEAAKSLVADLQDELVLIRKAGETEGQVRFPGRMSANFQLDEVQNSRSVVRLLVLDSYVAAHESQSQRIVENMLTVFALRDALQGEVTMIGQLVRQAIDAQACVTLSELMPFANFSDADLSNLQTALQRADFKESTILGLQGERAFTLEMIERFPLFVKANKLELLDIFEQCLSGMSGSWSESIDEQIQIHSELAARLSGRIASAKYIAVNLLTPDFDHFVIAGARAAARQRCMIALIAAQRHRLKYGDLPNSLEEIDPEFLTRPIESFVDPFDDKPLRFIKEVDRIVIYSVGRGKFDNGGDSDKDLVFELSTKR